MEIIKLETLCKLRSVFLWFCSVSSTSDLTFEVTPHLTIKIKSHSPLWSPCNEVVGTGRRWSFLLHVLFLLMFLRSPRFSEQFTWIYASSEGAREHWNNKTEIKIRKVVMLIIFFRIFILRFRADGFREISSSRCSARRRASMITTWTTW